MFCHQSYIFKETNCRLRDNNANEKNAQKRFATLLTNERNG